MKQVALGREAHPGDFFNLYDVSVAFTGKCPILRPFQTIAATAFGVPIETSGLSGTDASCLDSIDTEVASFDADSPRPEFAQVTQTEAVPALSYGGAGRPPEVLMATHRNRSFRRSWPDNRRPRSNAKWTRSSCHSKEEDAVGNVTERCIFSTHSLRATTATLLLDAGVDICKVQEFLGHRHVTTSQIYDKRRRATSDSASHDVPI